MDLRAITIIGGVSLTAAAIFASTHVGENQAAHAARFERQPSYRVGDHYSVDRQGDYEAIEVVSDPQGILLTLKDKRDEVIHVDPTQRMVILLRP